MGFILLTEFKSILQEKNIKKLEYVLNKFLREVYLREIEFIGSIPIIDYGPKDDKLKRLVRNSFHCFIHPRKHNTGNTYTDLKSMIYNQLFYWASNIPNNNTILKYMIENMDIEPFIADGSNPIENIEFLYKNYKIDIHENNLIYQACENIHFVKNPTDHIRKLLNLGVDINDVVDDETPIVRLVVEGGNFRLINYMLTCGANIYIKNGTGVMMIEMIEEINSNIASKILKVVSDKSGC